MGNEDRLWETSGSGLQSAPRRAGTGNKLGGEERKANLVKRDILMEAIEVIAGTQFL